MAAELPASLAANPRLSTWISLDEPGRITVRVGKVELGQGILTALAQIVAEELDVDLSRVTVRPASTAYGPAEGSTSGSLSIAQSGAALRQVCAEVRALLVAASAAKLGQTVTGFDVRDGDIRDSLGHVLFSYWDVADDVDLDRDAAGNVAPKVPSATVGPAPLRLDLPDKVFGRPRFTHDLALPGQLFGRVVRPPSRGATLETVDDGVLAEPEVLAVVRDGSFLGVVAAREEVAVRAASALTRAARWREHETLPDENQLPAWLRGAATDDTDIGGPPSTDVADGVVDAVRAQYFRPYLAHASVAPSCGIAQWEGGAVTVWSHTQNVHGLRAAIAQALRISHADVAVHHVEGAGCYGHNGADDAAFDAVLLARAVAGRPVQAVWSREDELAWAPFGPATLVELTAGVGSDGTVRTWRHEVWSTGHTSRPGYPGGPGLLAMTQVSPGEAPEPAVDPPLARGGGNLRNADPGYAFPSRHLVGHRILDMPLRTSALRSLGAFTNVFAIESFVDELAVRSGADPVEYRLRHLADERARAVVERAHQVSGWAQPLDGESAGRGIGFARYKGTGGYCAVVAEVEAVHEVRVRRLVVVADVGRIVSADGVANQLEGGAVQAASWTMLEQVRFDRRTVTSNDWETYPILRFSAIPTVQVDLVSRPDRPSVGAGEIAQGPTAAAIANAVHDALGVRIRDLPLTRERIIAAIAK
ncbi:MAG TPA: molybdopterin cofactor-binding domain-containing protein [Jiangellales bacterium]|nr:molybdopterin cofactor-binding domain-containing protein [Jiangellales bacterium]